MYQLARPPVKPGQTKQVVAQPTYPPLEFTADTRQTILPQARGLFAAPGNAERAFAGLGKRDLEQFNPTEKVSYFDIPYKELKTDDIGKR